MKAAELFKLASGNIRSLVAYARQLEEKNKRLEKRAEIDRFLFDLVEKGDMAPFCSAGDLEKQAADLMDADLKSVKKAMELRGNVLELGHGHGGSVATGAKAAKDELESFLSAR